jgi:molybdenum cofactor synthesis domain-containing protein
MIRARVITCSDAAWRGERQDRSGPAVREILGAAGFDVDAVMIVADDADVIATALENATADGARLVVTTGGTGIAPRDVTPEATARVCEKVLPGFGELMRATSKKGALSRAQAATRGAALIVNLPGSVNGATECLRAVLDLVPHALELLSGRTEHG